MSATDDLEEKTRTTEADELPSSGATAQDAATSASPSGTPATFNARIQGFRHTESVPPLRRKSPRLTAYFSSLSSSSSSSSSSSTDPSSLPPASSLKRQSSRASPLTRPSPSPKRRKSSGYVGPEAYAHLSNLQDVLEPGLICVFVGVNPGIATATQGHAYAHPSNMFWKLLHSSGLTDRRCRPDEDQDLPRLYSMGNTNIVERPTKDQSELSKAEMVAGTAVLEQKFRKYKPEVVCIVGKGIWEAIWRYKHGRPMKKEEFKYGWQDKSDNMGRDSNSKGSLVFVATSTSGLAASLSPAQKEAIWKPLGEWVSERRSHRAAAAAATTAASQTATA